MIDDGSKKKIQKVSINEGIIKGGINTNKPNVPRPTPPKGQGSSSNNTDKKN